MYDIIGDIHGHADKLEAILKKLEYEKRGTNYFHSERKVIFLGDYIDRGPMIRETVQIVRQMVENGSAIALMGNHEYNAICYHTQNENGEYLRERSEKNKMQHSQTLNQLSDKIELEQTINWFKTLPLFYENENFRAVHACWDDRHIDKLENVLVNKKLNEDLIIHSADKKHELYTLVDETLKGKELDLPPNEFINDKDDNPRTRIRIKWWENPATSTYRSISVEPHSVLTDNPVIVHQKLDSKYYHENNKPVFFGHYWLRGNPMLYRENICCCDYSVAKNGKLVAYRYDGEKSLNNSKFVFV